MGTFRHIFKTLRKPVLLLCLLVACVLGETKEGHCENNEFTPDILRAGYSTKFLNDVSQADASIALDLWTRETMRITTVHIQSQPLLYDDWQTMVHALKNREIHFVALTVMDYLKIKDKIPLEPALVGSKRGAVYGDEMVLIVRRGQGITDIGQLKGKRLMVHANLMTDNAYLWLSTVLTGKHLPDRERLFVSIREVKKASQALLPVFFKQADVCLVSKGLFDTMVELNPQLGKELVVLASSDKLLYGMFCFHKYLHANVKAQIIKAALNMNSTPTGKQILTLFQIDSIQVFKPSMLDTTIALQEKRNQQVRGVLAKKQKE